MLNIHPQKQYNIEHSEKPEYTQYYKKYIFHIANISTKWAGLKIFQKKKYDITHLGVFINMNKHLKKKPEADMKELLQRLVDDNQQLTEEISKLKVELQKIQTDIAVYKVINHDGA